MKSIKALVRPLDKNTKNKCWEIRINRKGEFDKLPLSVIEPTVYVNPAGFPIELIHGDEPPCEAALHRHKNGSSWINAANELHGGSPHYTNIYRNFLEKNNLINCDVSLVLEGLIFRIERT